MRRIKLFLTIFLLSILVQSGKATNVYPEWFLYPRNYPDLIVGYSYQGQDAEQNAENLYCAYKDCIAWGTLEVFDMEGNNELLKNSDYFYYFSPDSLEKIRGRLKLVDLFETNIFSGDYIAAFYPDTGLEISAQRLRPEDIPRPTWVDRTFWQDNQYYYGVGIYTSMGLENDAWKTAEEQAIFTILNALAVQVGKINLISGESSVVPNGRNMEEISLIRIKYQIKNITVVERYPDFKQKVFYVLVRIPKGDIWSPMMSR